MKNVITSIAYDSQENKLKLCGSIDEKFKCENIRIAFRERNNENYGIVSKVMLSATCYWQGLNFQAEINLDDVLEWRNDTILDLYIIDYRFKKYKFSYESSKEQNIDLNIKSKLLSATLISKENSIYIKVKERIVCEESKVEILENRNLELRFKLKEGQKLENDLSEVSLILKQRLSKEIFSYNNIANFEVEYDNNCFKALITYKDIMEKFCLADKIAFDFFIRIKSDNECLDIIFKIPNNFNSRIKMDEFYYGKVYCNYKKGLAMIVFQEGILSEANYIEVNNDIITINGNINSSYGYNFFKAKSIMVEPKMDKNYNSLVPFSKKYEIKSDDYRFYGEIYIESLLNEIGKYDNQILSIHIEIENEENGNIYKVPVRINENNNIFYKKKQITNEYEISIIRLNNDIAIKLNEKVTYIDYETIKIAVLGSCLSRLAFSSKDFFNPDYKSKYKVVNTMFHTSLISLFSEELTGDEMIKDEYLEYLDSEVLREYIKKDAKKTFFDEIKKSKPDFLVIDFYQDAVRDFIIFKNKKILSAGINLRESEYLDKIKEEAQIVTHAEANEFLEYWEAALRMFSTEITKYIDKSRIIINGQQSINEYIDAEGNVKKYKSLDQFVQRNNYFFEYMSKALINILPEAKLIDLNYLGYKAYALHPEGNTPTHYESQFYKDFIMRMDSLVLKVLLKEGRIKLN